MAKKKPDTSPKASPRKASGGAGDGDGSSRLPLSSGDSVQPVLLKAEMER